MISRHKNIFCFFLCTLSVQAQLPRCDLYLFKIEKLHDGSSRLSLPEKINSKAGYNNQPSFSTDSRSVYYSSAENSQSDIVEYQIKKRKNIQVTTTPESEFSPRVYSAAGILSVVRVESDSSQKIRFISKTGEELSGAPAADSVGYYCFLNRDTVVFYKLTEPHSLVFTSLPDSTEQFVASSVQRGFAAINRRQILFSKKTVEGTNYLIYDLQLKKIIPYATHKQGPEDLCWQPRHGLCIIINKMIMYFDPSKGWQQLVDLTPYGLHKPGRFVIDNKGKYLVVTDNL